MDDVVTVRRSFLNRIRAFLNVFSNKCKECFRWNTASCSECYGLKARELIEELDNVRNADEERYWQENPVAEREEMIIRAIRQAGRPLLSNEIKVEGISRSLKCFTLKRMCKKHILWSRRNEGGRYEFFIVDSSSRNKHNKHNKHKKGK